MMMRSALLAIATTAVAAQEATTLVVTVGTQDGFFKSNPTNPSISGDIGPLNPHDYRPNEFVTSDFIFEGLVAWDGENPAGTDGTVGTEDDYVVPSLATSWTTSISATNQYTITFKLRTGVTFHDDSPWNAAAAVANFEQIMGGTGVLGSNKALRGFHDWLGFTQYLDAWEAVDDMTFSLIFTNYYEAALRELATIRPFRMTSVATLPDLTKFELSALPERNGAIRNPWPPRCAARGLQCYMFRGVSAPIGTGPYKVVDKLLSSGRRTPAADFNATCYSGTGCNYQAGEYVQEILFTKFAGSWKSPTYDNVILRAYPSQKAVSDALIDGSLDIAYGVNTLSAAGLISLATPEGAPHVVAHQAATDVNTRNIAINSGTIYDINMRKFILGVLAASRQALYDGELAAERPMDTLFAPNAPHCGVLNTLSTPAAVAASGTGITSANFTTPLRLLYRAYEPHSVIIAAEVQAALFAAGIPVQPLATRTRDEYNNFNCDYKAAFSYGGDPLYGQAMSYGGELIFKQEHQDDPHKCNDTDHGDAHLDCLASVHTWDLSITQTWGPPYDPTSKLWDMTHNWCSGESDRPAVQNMDSMTITQFTTAVRGLSNIQDKSARETAYSNILTTLHDEAIFLPITAKRQTAATNVRVSGFKFGYMEFDLPLANLFPTTQHTATFAITIAGALSAITDVKRAAHKTAMASQLAVDESRISISYTAGSVVMTVIVQTDTADAATAMGSIMAALTPASLGTALGETVNSIAAPTTNVPATSDGLSDGAVAGIAAGAAIAGLLLICVICLICRETQGKPVFMSLDSTQPNQDKSKSSA